jgi:hypothetical protein
MCARAQIPNLITVSSELAAKQKRPDGPEGMGRQMQATVGMRRFGFGRFNSVAVKIAAVAGLAAAVATGATLSLDETLDIGGTSRTAPPKAYSVAQAGEGLAGQANVDITQLQAHTSDVQGEGLAGGVAVQPQLKAYTSDLQGEGIVGGHNTPATALPVITWVAIGAGEGWGSSGRPVEMPKAYSNPYMGEGIGGGHNPFEDAR